MSRAAQILHLVSQNVADAVGINPTFPLRHIAALVNRPWKVRVPGAGPAKITLRPGSSDASTVRQVFRDADYGLDHLPQWPAIAARYEALLAENRTPLIIDAGANIGAASIWFATQFPEAQVIAVEPDPDNALACRANVAGLPNVTLVEAAIGATPGRVSLTDTSEEWAVQTVRADDNSSGVSICTVMELKARVPTSALFLVKIDIEGFESDLFATNTEWVNEAKVIIVEPHDWMATARRSSLAFQRVMGHVGFEMLISGENLVYVAP